MAAELLAAAVGGTKSRESGVGNREQETPRSSEIELWGVFVSGCKRVVAVTYEGVGGG